MQRYAPIDYSFETTQKPPIRIAILTPAQQIDNIIGHLNNLNTKYSANGGEMFLPNYEGFYEIYKRALIIPNKNDTQLCRMYDETATCKINTESFINNIKSQIDFFQTQLSDFDVLVIYIPKSFAKFREDNAYDPDFNLHDAIKLYGTNKGVKIQFIEERSLATYDKCKVMWALSTSLYAKASGVLWHPVVLDDETAFVGISYAKSNTKGICIGCSQLFDSTGTGIRLILKKLDDPQYIGKNPYMKRDEARTTISKLREEYNKCDPVAKLRRIVIHKTTPFTDQEIAGFTEALEGIEDIELLQIQGYSPYRAIKYFIKEGKVLPNSFPLERGTTIKLSDDSFLLWTHGCVVGDDIGNYKYNKYYKGGRGIPIPVLVKRFYGKASGDTLVKEILMLTKMNWNSGDNLYKNMPVTLDFAKTLSRMSKQKEALYNKSYDFTGDAGSGPSEIRKYILENDLLEAIIALPNDIFYNTGIATYIWVLSNKKDNRRKSKVQLINANGMFEKRRKSLGNKRNDIPKHYIGEITRIYADFTENEVSKIFDNEDFGYSKIVVERPEKDENGSPVLKGGKPVPDTSLRDTENVPLKEDIQEYFKREVLPYASDAWIDEKKIKIGYEIPFTRYFYKYVPPKPSEDIMAEIKELEKSLDGVLEGIFND